MKTDIEKGEEDYKDRSVQDDLIRHMQYIHCHTVRKTIEEGTVEILRLTKDKIREKQSQRRIDDI